MLVIIALVLSFLIIFNIIKIIDSGFDSQAVITGIIFIVISVIFFIIIASVSLFSCYKLNSESLYIKIGFFNIKIDLKSIYKIVMHRENEESFIFYTKRENKKTHLICMDFDKQKEFIDSVTKLNQNIVFVIEDSANSL